MQSVPKGPEVLIYRVVYRTETLHWHVLDPLGGAIGADGIGKRGGIVAAGGLRHKRHVVQGCIRPCGDHV